MVFHPHFGEAEPGCYRPTTFADPANTFHEKAALCRAFKTATLAYAITDYKCQAKTFEWVVVDIKKPGGRGSSPAASAYVQLSRAKTRHSLSILRPFDPAELSSKLSTELLQELEWQAEKAKETEALYNF